MDCNPLFISSLNSGSNGNCYYVGNSEEAVLIDAGISCKETEIRMLRLGLSMAKVKAIFVSHEHSDHIKGLTVLAKKYKIPVYITARTLQNSKLKLPIELVRPFYSSDKVKVGSLTVTCFAKIHDAAEPHSFMVTCGTINVGVFTDLGSVCTQLSEHFKLCDAAFLEANYDAELLENGRYPYFLKQRIRGGSGHLSNIQALELFKNYRSNRLSHLLLAHLSKDNNDPELVEHLFNQHAGQTNIIVATRFVETPVYTIGAKTDSFSETLLKTRLGPQLQYSLGEWS